jgi:hypothetical protein
VLKIPASRCRTTKSPRRAVRSGGRITESMCPPAAAKRVRPSRIAAAPTTALSSLLSDAPWFHHTQASSANYVGGEALAAHSDSSPVGSHFSTRVRELWLNRSLHNEVAADFALNKRGMYPKARRLRTAYVLAQAPFRRRTSLRISSRR